MRSLIVFCLVLPVLFLFASCGGDATVAGKVGDKMQLVNGETMGTYYRVTYQNEGELPGLKLQLDSLLLALNMEVSTYIPSSLIARFNSGEVHAIDAETMQLAPHFLANTELALEIAEVTNGAFNPTIMPLVNYWGFGYTPKRAVTAVDSVVVDSLMQFVGLDKIDYDERIMGPTAIQLDKSAPGVQIDYSAIAKGYGVDLVAEFLRARGLQNFLVDIGGESYAQGNKGSADKPWRLAINVPKSEAALTDVQALVPLTNAALATSGNYRNFHEVNGGKYGHTINPYSGYPEMSRLLSATIYAPDCATADAYATASMVMGLDKAFTLIDSLPGLEGYFIYGGEDGALETKKTAGFLIENIE